MTSRGLPILVCLLLALVICTPTQAWPPHHCSDSCVTGGGAGSSVAGGDTGGTNIGGAAIGDAASRADSAATTGVGFGDAAPPRPYSLRAIYFRRDQFSSMADCLAAAYERRLPLEVCQ